MSETSLIELCAGDLVLRVSAEIGGTIVAFERRGAPIMLGIPVSDLKSAAADRAASFPMIPFANRALDNVLRVGGAVYRTAPNTAEPFAIHGCAWQRSWSVVRHDAGSLEIALDVPVASYPFAFAARQVFTLTPQGLGMTVSLTNTHNAPIPAGLGLHPYFPRHAGTRLQFSAARFWLEGPGYMPTDAITAPPELDFTTPRAIPARWRNNCYSGWDGKATIAQPELGYQLAITASKLFGDAMLFTPLGSPMFAFEPQSHTSGASDTDALIEPATPLALLAPGETLTGDVNFEISDYHTA